MRDIGPRETIYTLIFVFKKKIIVNTIFMEFGAWQTRNESQKSISTIL